MNLMKISGKGKSLLKNFGYQILIIAFVLTIVDVSVLWLLTNSKLAVRFEFVNNLKEAKPSWEIMNETEELYWNREFPSDDPIKLMSSLMNEVTKIDYSPQGDALSLYQHAKLGGGLVCSGMAKIFQRILIAKKFTVRRVDLAKNIGDNYSTHTTVEIFIDNHWIIFDPTFNITFKKNDKLIGAQDIHKALIDGTFNQIKAVFHGEVLYPARLDNYYMHYMSLYNNVLVEEPTLRFWHKLPPFRYWLGKTYYVQAERKLGQGNSHLIFFNKLNLIFVVILPTLLVILFLLGILLILLDNISSFNKNNK